MSASSASLDKQVIGERTAKILLEVRAVQFSLTNPFFFTSGWASPVFIDCRKLISYPGPRQSIIEFADTTLRREIGAERLDGIAGGETAGIPFAAWLADADPSAVPKRIPIRPLPVRLAALTSTSGLDGGLTVTVKVHWVVWPHASLAVQVTVVVPIGNVLPLGGTELTFTGEQTPLAELV